MALVQLHNGDAIPVVVQIRGSDDGIVWRPWLQVDSLDQRVPHHRFSQARYRRPGEQWITSPVETSEE
jgi:hypothetical protein